MNKSDLENLYKTDFMKWYETQTDVSTVDEAQYGRETEMVRFSVNSHIRAWLLEALVRMERMENIDCFTVTVPERLPFADRETFCAHQNREGVQITFHKNWGGE